MAVFDANFLVYWLDPEDNRPDSPKTAQRFSEAKSRVSRLVDEFRTKGEPPVVPAPALSEYLILAGKAGEGRIKTMANQQRIKIVPFGERAAIELAALSRRARDSGDKRSGIDAPWQKVKFDRQIVAIAKVEGEKAIYSEDEGLRKFAEMVGIKPYAVSDIAPA